MAAPVARGGDAESGAAPPTTVENATAPKTASTSGALMCCHGGLGPLRDRVWCQRIPAHAAALLALSAGLPSSSRWRTPTELKSSRSSESRAVTRGSMSMGSRGTMGSDELGNAANTALCDYLKGRARQALLAGAKRVKTYPLHPYLDLETWCVSAYEFAAPGRPLGSAT